MRSKSKYGWIGMALIAILSLTMGGFFILQTDPRSGIPDQSKLEETSGRLAWIKNYRYSTSFGLDGVKKDFNYPSKGSEMGGIRDRLTNAGDDVISVKYEREAPDLTYADDRTVWVWEIKIGGRSVRTYEQISEAWQSDNRLSVWLGAAMLVCGLYLSYIAWKLERTG